MKKKKKAKRASKGEKMLAALAVLVLFSIVMFSCDRGIISNNKIPLSPVLNESSMPSINSVVAITSPLNVSPEKTEGTLCSIEKPCVGTASKNMTANTTSLLPQQNQTSAPDKKSAAKVSQVEFFFLVKDKAYIQYILGEEQIKYYNFSGKVISIQPLIITRDSVKFRIDNYISKALGEGRSDTFQDFEVIVSKIYYRG